ncbi:DnaB-like helicase N-terminal domain-containing protein [Streptomyces decoyicus]|uniref:DnaB-like helicase N-terminal domain-containing protein n=1 Tax=Streptomyces decoyicus TaxID=249567 RepID=UPI0038631FAD
MTPQPDSDITTGDLQALDYAEQALLGGLLLAAGQLEALDDLLPEHFYRPVHSALFAAMRHLAATHHPALGERPTKEDEFAWVCDTVAAAVPEAPGLTPSYAHTLIRNCPTPSHVATYARMVLAGHTRRTVGEHALRVAQAAADRAHPDPVDATCAQVDQLTAVMGDLARRWRPHPGSLPRATPPDAPQAPPSEERLDDELMLLATAVAHPRTIREIRGLLLPDDFADGLHSAVFASLAGLAHRNDVIDPVTILWEAQRRRILTPAGPYTADQVLQLCQPIGGDPDY